MILIVDDKKENLLSLQSILVLHGFPVHAAESGEEALRKTLKNNYALIILDVQMPGMDGFEVAEMLAGYTRTFDVPIIFLSAASTEKKFITKGYSSGAVDYITKPIDPDIFLLKVKTLYKLYEQKRELSEMQEKLKTEIEYRKIAQQESVEKARQVVSVLESIPQIAFTISADNSIEFTNTQWRNYTKSAGAYPETHPDDPDLETVVSRMIKQEEPIDTEVRIRKPNSDTYRYFLLRTVPVREDGHIVRWVGTFTDIDGQKQVSKKKDEFISMASHELKTPLTSIKGYVQLLERSVEAETPMKLYVSKALTQIKKLDELIADLLDVSKIESGKLRMNMERFDFGKMLTNCIENTCQTYSTYEFQYDGFESLQVCGDESRLEQVVLNFLTNAVKYSPANKKVIINAAVKDAGQVEVKVRDFGIGIAKEEQSKVFEKFYRSDESNRSFQGLGLGLYISADILKRHGATYGVESEADQGSVFHFSLPIENDNCIE